MQWLRQRFFRYLACEFFLVVLLVLLGTLLRFAYFSTTMFWSNDISRDMLIAWQIAVLDHWPTVGHFNTGVEGFYQPYYYYFLGFLARVGGVPDFLYACFIALHSVSLIGIYLSAKNLFGRQAGHVALFLSAGAVSLIGLSHFPTAAPWSWPLYILSLTLTSFWFATKNKNYLWFAAGVSFVATQVHGSQLVFLLAILIWIGRQKLEPQEYLAWLGSWLILLINQQQLITTLLSRFGSSTPQFSLQSITLVVPLFIKTMVTHTWSFYGFWIIFGLLVIWGLWRRKKVFKHMNADWKFYAGYGLVFELLLGLLKTGVLPHHQYYIIPVVLIFIPGLVMHLRVTTNAVKNSIFQILLLGLFSYSLMIHRPADLGAFGDFYQTRNLYAELKQSGLPIQTATVVMTDNDPNRLADASNSTQLWWFLATDLGRTDFNASSWSLGNYASQLIVVCNLQSSAENNVGCDVQVAQIIAKAHRSFIEQSSVVMAEKFDVKLYGEKLQ